MYHALILSNVDWFIEKNHASTYLKNSHILKSMTYITQRTESDPEIPDSTSIKLDSRRAFSCVFPSPSVDGELCNVISPTSSVDEDSLSFASTSKGKGSGVLFGDNLTQLFQCLRCF